MNSEWNDAFKGGMAGITVRAPDVGLRATGAVLGVHVENDRNDPDFVLIAVNLRVRRRDMQTEDIRSSPVRRDPQSGYAVALSGQIRSDLVDAMRYATAGINGTRARKVEYAFLDESPPFGADVITPSARSILLPDSLVDRERIAREVEAERLRAEALNAEPLPDSLASALAKHGAPVRE